MNLENDWLKKDNATASSTVYYGYTTTPSSLASDATWAIRKITTSGTVDTVTWNDNAILNYNAIWDDRVETFIAPTSSISITWSVSNTTNSFNITKSIINTSWDAIKGINKYEIIVTDQNQITYDYLGNEFNNTYATSKITNSQNTTSYIFNGIPSMTYSITITGINAAGSTSSTVNVLT